MKERAAMRTKVPMTLPAMTPERTFEAMVVAVGLAAPMVLVMEEMVGYEDGR
jgi:hypothetical protein